MSKTNIQERINALAALPQFKGTAVREKCNWQSIRGWCNNGKLFPNGAICPSCHGLGFAGSLDVGDWQATLRQLHITYLMSGDETGVTCSLWLPGIGHAWGDILCPIELEAIVAALETARIALEAPKANQPRRVTAGSRRPLSAST